MNDLMYEKDEKLAHLLGFKTRLIGQKLHIQDEKNLNLEWTCFQTNNDLGKMKLLRLMVERKDGKEFFLEMDIFDLIHFLLNKTGVFRDEVIKYLEHNKTE